jgi:hypothetical protein
MSDVYLNTQDRLNPTATDANSCVVPVRYEQNFSARPLAGGYTTMLMDCKIKYSWYGIDTTNNVFLILSGATTYTYTITPGIYSGTSLAAQIQTQITNVVGTPNFLVTFSATTQKLTISNTAAFTLLVDDAAFNAQEPFGTPLIGDISSTPNGARYEVISPIVVDTNHIDFCYVYVDWPGVGSVVSAAKDENNNTLVGGKVPVVSLAHTPDLWGQNCIMDSKGSYWHSDSVPNQVTMRLYDHDWNLVDTKGQNWAVHLKLYDLPGQAKSPNHVTQVRHSDSILSNAERDDSQPTGNTPTHPRRGNKRAWEQPSISAPSREFAPQRAKLNYMGKPNDNFGV